MTTYVDIYFWVEGDDPKLHTLHEDIGTQLERGWSKPCERFTSIVIAEDFLLDDGADSNGVTNSLICNWLNSHRSYLDTLSWDNRGVKCAIVLPPNLAYDWVCFNPDTVSLASEMRCGLSVMAYRGEKDSQSGGRGLTQ